MVVIFRVPWKPKCKVRIALPAFQGVRAVVEVSGAFHVSFGSNAADQFGARATLCPLLSNRVLNGAVPRTQSCATCVLRCDAKKQRAFSPPPSLKRRRRRSGLSIVRKRVLLKSRIRHRPSLVRAAPPPLPNCA